MAEQGKNSADSPKTDIEAISLPMYVWLLGVGGFWFLIIIYLSNQLFSNGGISAIDAAASVLLSLTLVILYRRQTQIQETQTELMNDQSDIMDEQTSLMRVQHSAHLRVNSWRVKGNVIQFDLSNLGHDVAAKLEAGIAVYPQNIDYSEDFGYMTTSMSEIETDHRRNFLGGKQSRTFESLAVASVCVHNVQHWNFTRIVNTLISYGETKAEFMVIVTYQNIFGETEETNLISFGTDLQPDMTFEQAITGSRFTNRAGLHKAPDSFLQLVARTGMDNRGTFYDPRFRNNK